MTISREEYKRIIDAQRSGKLTIFIDTSAFRQMFCNRSFNLEQFATIVGESAKIGIRQIRALTIVDSFIPVLASVLAVLGFGWWGIVVVVGIFIVWLWHKMYACRGKQHGYVLPFPTLLFSAVTIAIIAPLPNIWARWFVVFFGVMLFVGRMLYCYTAYIVFWLIYSSYEFFNIYYMEPKGAIVPLIWTSELDREYSDYNREKKK